MKKPTGMTGGKLRKKKEIPKWIKAIPHRLYDHGSGSLQKKLWRLVSDYVRIRDWSKYRACTATGRRIGHWKEGQAGHFKSYTKCNGMMKFDERNIFLQSPSSNGFGDYDDWKLFELELKHRGIDTQAWARENLRHSMEQVSDTKVIEKMQDILGKMKDLPEKPEYYARVTELATELAS